MSQALAGALAEHIRAAASGLSEPLQRLAPAATVGSVVQLREHPLPVHALKSGLAAGVAWKLGTLLPGALDQQPSYAALGAVTVMYSALKDSLAEGIRVVVAIIVGVCIACGVSWLWSADALTVGVVILLGTVVAATRLLGAQGAWVPIAGLFALTSGASVPTTFSLAYVVQVTLGALIGLTVNLTVLPPLALYDVRRQIVRVRHGLVDQLQATETELRSDEPPSARWRETLAALAPAREMLGTYLARARRAAQANPRARQAKLARRQHQVLADGAAMERISWLVEALIIGIHEDGTDEALLPEEGTARRTADVLESLAVLLNEPRSGLIGPDRGKVRQAEQRIEESIRFALENAASTDDLRLRSAMTGLKARSCLRAIRGTSD